MTRARAGLFALGSPVALGLHDAGHPSPLTHASGCPVRPFEYVGLYRPSSCGGSRGALYRRLPTAGLRAGLFPPWIYTATLQASRFTRDAGYEFLATPPTNFPGAGWGVVIDFSRLGMQWGLLTLICAGLFVSIRKSPDRRSHE